MACPRKPSSVYNVRVTAALTIVGLGPGSPDLVTREAWAVLSAATEVYLRTGHHPTTGALPAGPSYHTFDYLYEEKDTFDEVYAAIVDAVLALASRPQGVVYAVPGDPLVGEATVRGLLDRAQAAGLAARIVHGLSFLEPVCAAVRLDPVAAGLQIVDALSLDTEAPLLQPQRPVVVAQVYSSRVASGVKLTLLDLYPPEHVVTVVNAASTDDGPPPQSVALADLDRACAFEHLTTLVVPALPPERDLRTFAGLRHIVHRLRAPGGCPWDRKQTHQTLKQFLLEEAYETLHALDEGDAVKLSEELGDLMLQILLHVEIAAEAGEFRLEDVFGTIGAKLVRRHPHVFGDVQVSSAEEVVGNWEAIKAEERGDDTPLLSGVPQAMPALALAQSLQARAGRMGFRWPRLEQVLAKLAEEMRELSAMEDAAGRREEFGDVLFVLTILADRLGVNAEEALRLSAAKFRRRFGRLESLARRRGRALAELSLKEMESLWEQAKQAE